MHKSKISIIKKIIEISRQDYQPHVPRTALPVYNEGPKAFMNRILSRFARSTQMGYSVPRLIWAFYEHMVLKEQFERFFQTYIFFFICQFHITRETIDCLRFIRCEYEDYWYEAGLLDLAGFLADRILVRFSVWSAYYVKQAIVMEAGSPYKPQLSVTRDHARCMITGRYERNETLQHGESIEAEGVQEEPGTSSNQLRSVYIFPPRLLPVSDQTNPTGEEENYFRDMRHAIRSIIEMFDPSIKNTLSPTSLRNPVNMLTLDRAQHELFASSLIYFEKTSSPFEYRLWSPLEDHVGRRSQYYTTVKLPSNEGIEAPSEQLLDIHRIMTRILAVSGAREYVNLMVERWEECTGGSG